MRLAVAVLLMSMVALFYSYSEKEGAAPTFITAPVERGNVAAVVTASGSVEAVVAVDVSSQLSGRIAKVFVDFNDKVKSGEPIAQIDQEIFAAKVNEARAALSMARANAQLHGASLERAKGVILNAQTAKRIAEEQFAAIKARQDELTRDLQRQIELVRRGSGTERDLTQLQAQHDAGMADQRASLEQIQMKAQAIAISEAERDMAEANLANALAVIQQNLATLDETQADLDRTVLRAPIDGVIIKRDVNPGQTVAVSLEAKTLFTIANDLREMEVKGKIDEADIGQLKVGQAAEFTVDAYPDKIFRGKVLQIRKSPEPAQNVVTYTTIISAPNPDLLLFPGMTAQLRIVVRDTDGVLKIPSQALRFRPSDGDFSATRPVAQAASSKLDTIVWLVGHDRRPRPVAVKIGISDDASTALLEGPLKEGQRVIVGIAHSPNPPGYFGIRVGF